MTVKQFQIHEPDGSKRSIELKLGSAFASGGGGDIYQNPVDDDTVIKLYKGDPSAYQDKVKAMIAIGSNPKFNPRNNKGELQLTWPNAHVTTSQGEFVGYRMLRLKTENYTTLSNFTVHANRHYENLPESSLVRFFIAVNLSGVLAQLHKSNCHVIDLKPPNIFVNLTSYSICLIDCDGFTINLPNGTSYPALQATDEYLCANGQSMIKKGSIEQYALALGETQDRFALSTLIFQLLNNDVHPFDCISTKPEHKTLNSRAQKIAHNLYAYGVKERKYIKPRATSIHEYLDDQTRMYFDHAFDEPDSSGVAAKVWYQHLRTLHQNKVYRQCDVDKDHYQFTEDCGLCLFAKTKKSNRKTSHTSPSSSSSASSGRGISIQKIIKSTTLPTIASKTKVSKNLNSQSNSWIVEPLKKFYKKYTYQILIIPLGLLIYDYANDYFNVPATDINNEVRSEKIRNYFSKATSTIEAIKETTMQLDPLTILELNATKQIKKAELDFVNDTILLDEVSSAYAEDQTMPDGKLSEIFFNKYLHSSSSFEELDVKSFEIRFKSLIYQLDYHSKYAEAFNAIAQFNEYHPESELSIWTKAYQARLMVEANRFDQANLLFDEIFKDNLVEQYLNKNEYIDSMLAYSTALVNTRNIEKSIEISNIAVDMSNKFYGTNNVETIATKESLATLYRRSNEYEISLEYYKEAYEVYKANYGANNSGSLTIRRKMAALIRDHFSAEEAVLILEDIIFQWLNNEDSNDNVEFSIALTSLGKAYKMTNHPKLALDFLTQSETRMTKKYYSGNRYLKNVIISNLNSQLEIFMITEDTDSASRVKTKLKSIE